MGRYTRWLGGYGKPRHVESRLLNDSEATSRGQQSVHGRYNKRLEAHCKITQTPLSLNALESTPRVCSFPWRRAIREVWNPGYHSVLDTIHFSLT